VAPNPRYAGPYSAARETLLSRPGQLAMYRMRRCAVRVLLGREARRPVKTPLNGGVYGRGNRSKLGKRDRSDQYPENLR
jgi:hypothetical protein